VLETTLQERGGSASLVDDIAREYPFGAGLGTVGPASRGSSSVVSSVNGETEFNFLLVELGVLGAICFLIFPLRLVAVSFSRIRRLGDPALRLMLAALAAPLAALLVIFFSGAPTSSSPAGPYLWGVGGILLFWVTRRPAR
jgi:hypothetical protein